MYIPKVITYFTAKAEHFEQKNPKKSRNFEKMP